MLSELSRVFRLPKGLRAASARVVCFPFAGGSARSFAGWDAALQDVAQILPVELPGRGPRFGEACNEDASSLSLEIADALTALPDVSCPLLLYGHSMGTILAYETARLLAARRAPVIGLVLTGRHAPHWPGRRRDALSMNDAALIEDLRSMGGTAPEVLASPELLALMLPVLRSDYRLVENYRPDPVALRSPLPLPAEIIGGDRDARNPRDGLEAWREAISGPVEVSLWQGGHFFIHEHRDALLARIRRCLATWQPPAW